MINVKCGKEITVQIPLDGTSPTLHAREAVIELDTVVSIENGVMFRNNDTKIALEVTDEILVTSPIACLRVYAPDVLEQIKQNFIRPCTL